MRFFADGPSLPDALLERCDAGRVVFLCGAGVSFNSGMPTFLGLTEHVINFFDPPADSQIMKAFSPWKLDPSAANVPLDQIFNLLHLEYGRDEVNTLVTERLLVPSKAEKTAVEHRLIKRISSNQSGNPQIVTTNFDRLFEFGDDADSVSIHVPPAFPDLAFGSPIDGITYLHGRLVSPDASQHPYVLSSADFGRAYLSEAWATKFIRGLLERYTVVLVGYQAEDPPVKYLLQGLNHDGQFDRTRLYAFDKGEPEEIEAKWRDRGVTAIAYHDHKHLWQTMETWADRADNPRTWRNGVVTSAQHDPKEMMPHERGQVAHVLRSVPGARIFADADPLPHPEWVCVLDALTRCATKSTGYGDNAEVFEPELAYGLDDDLGPIRDEEFRRGIRNDHLLEWRHGDNNPTDFHHLGARQMEGHESIPIRLLHLIRWIAKSYDSPVIAWWAARQHSLHPRLVDQIAWHLDRAKAIDGKCRHVWNLILEHHRDPRNRQWNGRWYDLKSRIAREGWIPSVLRDFHRASQPCLEIRRPTGLHENKPPTTDWGNLEISEIARFEVKYLERRSEELEVPNEALPTVFGILEEQLSTAAGMLLDTGVSYFTTPTCYPDRDTDSGEHYYTSAEPFLLFTAVFDRMVALDPRLAKAHATLWDEGDRYFFRKLKLYALSKPDIFDANEAASTIASFDQEAFWDINVVRELLFALVDRWSDISEENKEALAGRILAGPDKMDHWSEEEYPALRDRSVATYGRYLKLNGCDLPAAEASKLDEIVSGIPEWADGRASSIVIEHGIHGGFVETDETPDLVIDLPVNEIVDRARADLPQRFPSLTERRPFTGLVKTNPRKALAALTFATKNGDYPEAFWSTLVNELPENVPPRLYRVFLHRLTRLPHAVIVELHHTLGRWLESNLGKAVDFDCELGWRVYDHIVDGILSGGPKAVESGIGDVRQGGEVVQRSRRTLDHAINGPIGMCAEALLAAMPGETQAAGSLVPAHIRNRIERLLASGGEGSDHAVAILMSRLNWAMHVDPEWTNECLISMLAFEHSVAEPAWNGLLHSRNNPTSAVATAIKPLLLKLYPWIEQFHWRRNSSERAASWMAWMCIFRPGKPDGLNDREMRHALRAMSDYARNQLILWLGRVGQSNDDGWNQLVIPFINNVWPRERVYRTSASVSQWISVLDDTKDDFPLAYAAVKRFLVPVESDGVPLYRFTREVDGEEPITIRYPEATLDFLNTITPLKLSRPSYELPMILELIKETDPELTTNPKYLRLIDLVERN